MMEDYKKRMRDEYHELKERMAKLHCILIRNKAGKLDFALSCPVELLEEQYAAMELYADVLEARAMIEEVSLAVEN